MRSPVIKKLVTVSSSLVILTITLAACEGDPGLNVGQPAPFDPSPTFGQPAPETGRPPPTPSSTSPEASPPSKSSFDPYCERIFGFHTAVLDRCCSTQEETYEASRYKTSAENIAWCTGFFAKSVAKKRIAKDVAALDACLVTLDPTKTSCAVRRPHRSTFRTLPVECRSVYKGLVAQGGACQWNDEGVTGLICKGGNADANIDGVCTPSRSLGEKCPWTDDLGWGSTFRYDTPECAAGLRCGDRTIDGETWCVAATAAIGEGCPTTDECTVGLTCSGLKCMAPGSVPIGGSCGGELSCADSAFCPIPSMNPSAPNPTCTSLLKTGSTCFFDDECEGRCDVATKKCVAHCGGG